MKRKGTYKPTIEDTIELAGIEILHPGGFALTKRTAEFAGLTHGLKVLDVSSGRGTQSRFYAKEYGVQVTGIDISDDMVRTATAATINAGLSHMVNFCVGDSQLLPFSNDTFDVVINECAVGIPDDSQKVLVEMVRVLKPGGKIIIHESTWRGELPETEKEELSERYGTTPLLKDEWLSMLHTAGVKSVVHESEPWSQPEMFWKIRKDRDVKHWLFTMSIGEKLKTMQRIFPLYGINGIFTALNNERIFFKAVRSGKIGYTLFRGEK